MLSRSSRSLRKALTGVRAFSSGVPDVMVRARRDGAATTTRRRRDHARAGGGLSNDDSFDGRARARSSDRDRRDTVTDDDARIACDAHRRRR